jgi:hypothetical protein
MHNMMSSGMIWGMEFAWILLTILCLLAILAMVKYLFLQLPRLRR